MVNILCFQFLVVNAVGGIVAEALLAVLLILRVASFKEIHLRVALEGENMGADTVEEPAVVAYDHGTAGKVFQALFQSTHSVDIDIVGRLVEEQHVGLAFERQSQVKTVAFAAAEHADLLALVGAAEIETADVGTAVDESSADLQVLVAA